MEFPEFLKRKPEDDTPLHTDTGNEKGKGFRFIHVPKREDVITLVQSRRTKIAVYTAIGTLLIFTVVTKINAENAFMMLAVLGVGALLIYDIITRRHWEGAMTAQLKTLTQNHDRLVREVARNRADVSVIKEGLHETASAVQGMGRHYSPSTSIEARMIETIVTQLGALGQTPRTALKPVETSGANIPPPATLIAPDPVEEILKLEVAPPPRLQTPPAALEAALGPNFDKFSDTVILELIRHAVRHDHLDVFVQPIVSLPQRKLRMYEVFARLRANAGAYIPAARYLELAQKESLVSAIDNLLLLRCLQILRDRRDDRMETPYVLNITSATLADTGFMNDLVMFLAEYRRLASRLVFEMPLSDIEGASPNLLAVLDGLAQLGCQFSVDRVRKRRVDIAMLRARHVRYLKLDASWLLREAAQDGGPARIIALKKMMDQSGVDLIVEKIERDAELRELLDYGIDFGQGYLFGKPDLHAVYHARERREAVGMA